MVVAFQVMIHIRSLFFLMQKWLHNTQTKKGDISDLTKLLIDQGTQLVISYIQNNVVAMLLLSIQAVICVPATE